MSELDLAYAAGIVDGEGSICIVNRNHNTNSSLGLVCQVSVTSHDLIEWLYQRFSGSVTEMKYRKRTFPSHKPMYQWMLRQGPARDFIRNILPYLVIKIHQAELALQFPINATGSPISFEQRQEKIVIKEIMEELNDSAAYRRKRANKH